ncbi:hypothetical protein KY289_016984 [Solanum tuberosum]|nr:hypothetical protein KY289_016984 [Solanum tuberosum]
MEGGLLLTSGRRPRYTVGWASGALTNESADRGHLFLASMRDDIECYVQTCLVCQQDKVEQRHPKGLLEPLPVAECPLESVTMEFITSLPKSDGYRTIMVMTNRFSKYATFIPVTAGCTAKEAARLFFKNVVKY